MTINERESRAFSNAEVTESLSSTLLTARGRRRESTRSLVVDLRSAIRHGRVVAKYFTFALASRDLRKTPSGECDTGHNDGVQLLPCVGGNLSRDAPPPFSSSRNFRWARIHSGLLLERILLIPPLKSVCPMTMARGPRPGSGGGC